ncbi:MAG: hypothetical protein KBC50_03570 [Candidatus Pacebacteria bacterium]|nr:hypothetical protein [Candidatus Paceibacterota bacterium]
MQSQTTQVRFSVGEHLKLISALSEVHVMVFREGKHQQFVVESAALLQYLRGGSRVIAVQELKNPVPDLASETAGDCYHQVCFGEIPNHGLPGGPLYFPAWQFQSDES